jgi:hypothetical protein
MTEVSEFTQRHRAHRDAQSYHTGEGSQGELVVSAPAAPRFAAGDVAAGDLSSSAALV